MELGRWELVRTTVESDGNTLMNRWFARYGLISKEVSELENDSPSWNECYLQMKNREYAGDIVRGYYIEGISGIQFMLPEAVRLLGSHSEDYCVVNAIDPAQAYGRILPHCSDAVSFSCIASTVIVLKLGKVVTVLEKYGERLTTVLEGNELRDSLSAVKNAFQQKRIWPVQKKLIIKVLPQDERDATLSEMLKDLGFEPEINRFVYWRR